MGIIADALQLAATYDVDGEIVSQDKPLHRDLVNRPDLDYSGNQAPVNELQTITPGDRTGGTFDLVFNVSGAGFNNVLFSVLGLAFNAAASAVQTAVDAAADGVVPGYALGDIGVTGGAFGAAGADTLFTFTGSLGAKDQGDILVVGTSLTGGTTDPVRSETTKGQVARFWFSVLVATGVLQGTVPAFGAAPAGQFTATLLDAIENYPRKQTIVRLIQEAEKQEGQPWIAELFPLLGYDRV